MRPVKGLHHITAICRNAQENVDFYAGVLGMRLVKKSVNQDDPGTYHLFYADAVGHPGTDLTFFPWEQMAAPVMGHGLAVEVQLEVPNGSLAFWGKRLQEYGAALSAIETRFGQDVLPVVDPHGMRLALVADERSRAFEPWSGSPVPVEHQVRGLYGARLWERDAAATASFIESRLGFEKLGEQDGWTRYGFRDAAGIVDVRETPSERRGRWGTGAVHHLAWRVDDEAHQLAVRGQVEAGGASATPVIDRFWFKSVYFKEPGGVLFELATEGPGFAVDEDPAHLGESLVLPPFLQPYREKIEAVLPELTMPGQSLIPNP
ncbi:MAG TPA: ring-cleaving dioxygenase [Vicinamibacterales bacterium]|nr:ring-cleaving dioxygenase [Vicinamibacterales bacterium]